MGVHRALEREILTPTAQELVFIDSVRLLAEGIAHFPFRHTRNQIVYDCQCQLSDTAVLEHRRLVLIQISFKRDGLV